MCSSDYRELCFLSHMTMWSLILSQNQLKSASSDNSTLTNSYAIMKVPHEKPYNSKEKKNCLSRLPWSDCYVISMIKFAFWKHSSKYKTTNLTCNWQVINQWQKQENFSVLKSVNHKWETNWSLYNYSRKDYFMDEVNGSISCTLCTIGNNDANCPSSAFHITLANHKIKKYEQ